MNLPVIVTVPRRKLHVVRFQIKVGKCGQRTGRWMVNTCHNILLNLVYKSLKRYSVVPSCNIAWVWRQGLMSYTALVSIAISKTAVCFCWDPMMMR